MVGIELLNEQTKTYAETGEKRTPKPTEQNESRGRADRTEWTETTVTSPHCPQLPSRWACRVSSAFIFFLHSIGSPLALKFHNRL